ncbi:MAG TPA: lasso peptide biosynthesis B2 protein [Pyrinomonadaceae bacterium]|nr:lasso peptide biosynthesis B2 protein [Pyrinomonadaceae bacterium]
MNKIAKTIRLFSRGARKIVTRPDEAWLMLRMAWWVAVLSAMARFYSLPRALEIVAGKQNGGRSGEALNREDLARTIDLLLSADVLVFKPICWKRAAVLHRYLSRNGTETKIIFGVRNESGGKFDGHAWLEADGQPILEKDPPNYVVTYSFP